MDSIYLNILHRKTKPPYTKSKVKQRTNAFLDIQKFKQDCFREITKVLEVIRPENGIEWRFEKRCNYMNNSKIVNLKGNLSPLEEYFRQFDIGKAHWTTADYINYATQKISPHFFKRCSNRRCKTTT